VTVDERDHLAKTFEESRAHLRAVAYRMLGSLSEADDAVQEAWLRLSRTDASEVQNLRGWLTTVVARICLDMLRSRTARRESPIDAGAPEPATNHTDGSDPEHEAVLADNVGLALLVVLETLAPAERLAFVLHDLFAVSFEEIATIVGRSPAAARQLASRARRRVQGAPVADEAELARQRALIDAFLTALRGGDFDAMIALLDPDLVVRADFGPPGAPRETRGAVTWAKQAVPYGYLAKGAQPALVAGSVGIVFAPRGRLLRALHFTFDQRDDKITSIEITMDPEHLSQLEVAVLPNEDAGEGPVGE
jgi:RNA polymerase sigma-70 factor (ECF subfamily)